jgi:AFG3 family protein
MAKKNSTKKPILSSKRNITWVYILVPLVLLLLWFSTKTNIPEITWRQFETEMLSKHIVEKLDVVNNERVEVYLLEDSLIEPQYQNPANNLINQKSSSGPHYYFNIGSIEVFNDNMNKAQLDFKENEIVPITYVKRSNWWEGFGSTFFVLGLFFVFWMLMLRGAGGMKGTGGSSIFNFGQSKARLIEKGEKSSITFNDVAGIEEAKEELFELVKFLKNPTYYKRLGAKIPKGVLLIGPPGTGKTLLAKAVAGEAGVPFFSLSGSEFIEMFVGVGAARMRDLFDKAKAKAPSIIFIDEIDTVGRSRGKANAFQANDERESTLNQLLAELDGFDQNTGVIVLAATNRGDILDHALLRPGRFDRHIQLELPNLTERKAIFKVHLAPIKVVADLDVGLLAAQTPGFSGADIANICNEGALIATRRDKKMVERQDFMDAIDRVVGGLEKKTKIITPEEKKRVAYHEAGHVTASWYLEHSYPILKVSIIPRGKSLGAAWYLPEEHQIITKSQFIDTICAALGGRAAEDIIFHEISSNALDDLEKATKQAYNMVINYGLSDVIRNISYYDSTGRSEQSLHKPYSEKTAEKIDEEVQRIIDEAYDRTIDILSSHKEQLKALAEALIKKETVHKEELTTLLGKRIFNKIEKISP